MQYTLRRISTALDAAIRRRARQEGKSLNEVAVEALARGVGLVPGQEVQRDLSDVVKTWKRDAALESALKAQDRIDPGPWK
jgi:hypothetical protein